MKRLSPIALIFCLLILHPARTQTKSLFQREDQIPKVFDLRNVNGKNYVTNVRHQRGGTCWTHGVMAAIEGNLMITGVWEEAGEPREPDLAEYHLDWWNGFNKYYNEDIDPRSGGLDVHYGGDYRVASAYTSRGEGPVRDIDAQMFDSPPSRYNPTYHHFYIPDIEWYTVGDSLEGIDIIKTKIMQYGVMGTCMYSNSEFLNNLHYTHYQPPNSPFDPNHAIAITGWNDTLTTQAPQPGAWLCKNSWGVGFGLGGYFWISYYDKHSTRNPEMGAILFQDVEPLQYSTIYYHDYHGWRETKADCFEGFNCFTAESEEYLSAVSFFTAADSIYYVVKIYDKYEDYELKNLLSTKSGNINHLGFHTVKLDTVVELMNNDDFYIYLYLSQGGHPYDCTSEVPVLLGANYTGTIVESTANPGESFFLQNGQWFDFTEFNATGNLCIKGLTVQEQDPGFIIVKSGIPSTFKLLQNFPNPFNNSTFIKYTLRKSSRVNLTIYDITGRKVITLVDKTEQAGEKCITWNGKNSAGADVSSGVYIYSLKTDNDFFSKRMVLIR